MNLDRSLNLTLGEPRHRVDLPPSARRLSFAIAAASATVAAFATAIDRLDVAVFALASTIGMAAVLRWPALTLFAYVISIPFNAVLQPGPLGTVSRIIGIVFVATHLLLRFKIVRPSLMPIQLWAYLIWVLASCLWAVSQDAALGGWITLVQLVVASVVVASIVIEDATLVTRILSAYAMSASVVSVIATVSYLRNPAGFLTRASAFGSQDPALFAATVLPALVFALYVAVSHEQLIRVRLLASCAVAACAIGLLLSGTRSSWVGLAAAGLAWLLIRRSRHVVVALAAVAAPIMVMAVVVPGFLPFLVGRIVSATSSGGAGRTDIWAVAITIFSTAPFTGVGFAGFPLAFTQHAIDVTGVVATTAGILVPGRAPHNVWLGALIETGIVGAVLLGASMVRAYQNAGHSDAGLVARLAFIALLVQACFLDILEQKEFWMIFALCVGLSAARGREPVMLETNAVQRKPEWTSG